MGLIFFYFLMELLKSRLDRNKGRSKEKAMKKMKKLMAKSGPQLRSEMMR